MINQLGARERAGFAWLERLEKERRHLQHRKRRKSDMSHFGTFRGLRPTVLQPAAVPCGVADMPASYTAIVDYSMRVAWNQQEDLLRQIEMHVFSPMRFEDWLFPRLRGPPVAFVWCYAACSHDSS